MYSVRFLFIVLIALGLGAEVFAQRAITISGTVKSEEGQPLPGISIILKGTSLGTTTENDGSFQLSTERTGSFSLVVSSVGYLSQSREISLTRARNLTLHFILRSDSRTIDEVTIHGKTENQELKEQPFTINAIETRQFANTTADLNQILSRSTGVRVREQGGLGSDFNFSINGLSGKQVKFFMDGVPMESFGNSLSLNNIPVNLIQRMEVYKGVVPVYLGSDALGGAVNIVTNQSLKNFVDASYSYGSFNSHRAALTGRYTNEKTGLVVNATGFYNYSDNNYLMRSNAKYDAKIEVIENGQYVEKNVRRFHDAYRSAMGQAEVGFVNKKWADLIMLGVLYSGSDKEMQTGANQNKVIGGVTTKGTYLMPTLKYRKNDFLVRGLSANLFASYAVDKTVVTDTSSNVYGWGGVIKKEFIAGELGGVKTLYHYKNKSALVRANFSYEINKIHSINLNYNFSHFERTAHEDVDPSQKRNSFAKPNSLGKNIVGLAWQSNFLDGRLSNTLFGKYYGFDALVREALNFGGEAGWQIKDSKNHYDYFGYGVASRFKVTENAGIKASFEHAYRLQDGSEIFGDGITVIANPQLKPEQSNNVNIGGYYTGYFGKHRLTLEASWFYRNAKDFIYFVPTGGLFSSYKNVGIVKVNGFEGEIRYDYNQLLNLSVNASYQNAVNNRKTQPNSTQPDVTFGDRIPNQPWVYANAEAGIGKNDWLGKNSRIQFSWYSQYVHWFYLSWESLGSKASKNRIPTQLIHNASVSYSWKDGRYNVAVESRNLTNELAYDNFRLQKPGRAFSVKLRYFFKQDKTY